jgi:outer membrane protein TolC
MSLAQTPVLKRSIRISSLAAGPVFLHGFLIGAISPPLHLPIFDRGRIEGAYRGARASYDKAVANYDKTLVTSLKDVAGAMTAKLERERNHSRAAPKEIDTAYKTAKARYEGGLARYLDVLTAEATLVLERRRVPDLDASELAQDVVLIRALGGGFHS